MHCSYIAPARAKFGALLLFTISLLLAGCAAGRPFLTSASALPLSGNWQISSTATAASRLPQLSGTLSDSNAAITGIVHSDSKSACIAPTSLIALSGTSGPDNLVTLIGHEVDGGTLTITGTAADGKSVSNATYNVAGGTCAFAKPAEASVQQHDPISGTYSGSFSDVDGVLITVQATLNQSLDANGDGNYTLSGTASLPSNPCFPTNLPVSDTEVTGGAFTFTFTTTDGSNSVTATGTFNDNASVLTINGWESSGACGADSGTGSMSQ